MICLSSIFFISADYTKWEKEISYNGISFDKVRFHIEGSDTLEIEGYLSQPTNINGIPCSNYIVLKEGGRLKKITLSEDFYMFDITFPKGSLLNFKEEGLSCYLSSNTMVQGFLCSGNYTKKISKSLETVFYPNGELKWFYPPEDVLINQVYCKGGKSIIIGLYMNGRLMKCTLSQDQIIDGAPYDENTVFFFFPESGEPK